MTGKEERCSQRKRACILFDRSVPPASRPRRVCAVGSPTRFQAACPLYSRLNDHAPHDVLAALISDTDRRRYSAGCA